MKIRTWCLAAVCMIAGSALNVQASESVTVGDGWKTWFDGEQVESNFSRRDILNVIGEMQPGDSVTLKIGIENQDNSGSDWYMRNQVLESLEKKGNPASGGAYTYRLSYVGADGNETVFFDSDSVGGEDSDEGLKEATSSMEEWFYVDNIAPSRSGSISLTVALDGETQGNNYQNTLAELELAFAVEPDRERVNNNPSGGGGSGSGGDGDSTGGGAGTQGPASLIYAPGAVQTGDTGDMVMWSVVALICGLLLMVLGFVSCKRDKGGR